MSVRENRIPNLSVLDPGDIERMLGGDGRGWVCEVDGQIVGFAIADLSNANVYALFVDPEFEGRGIGRRLHNTMMNWCFSAGPSKVWLSTDPNTRAEYFYRRAGWVEAGIEPNGEIRFEMARERWPTSP
jgi:GNAT superfamily N-acetyltransferase